MCWFVCVKRYGNKRRHCFPANAALDGGEDRFPELGGIRSVMTGFGAKVSEGRDTSPLFERRARITCDIVQYGGQVAQGAPAFGIHGEAIDQRMDITAVLAFGAEVDVVGSTISEQMSFLFPSRPQFADGTGIARLPIVTAEIFELKAGLVTFKILAREIEQRHEPAAHVRVVAPGEHSERGVGAFGLVEFVVLVAGAVVNAIAVNQFKVLDDEIAPGVVYDWLRAIQIHATRE